MQVGISTACFYPQMLEKTFSQIADMGFKKIEVFFNTESELHSPLICEFKNIIKSLGLEVVSIHPYTSLMEGMLLFSEYERRTQDGFKQYISYFEAGNILGAKYLTFHGERKSPFDKIDSGDIWQRKVEVYNRLCDIADSYGVAIAQENVAWCKSSSPEYIKRLYNDVPKLSYTLDLKQANRAGHLWHEYYDIMAKRLKNIHINDFDENNSCLLSGKGIFDYSSFFERLKKDKYSGDVLIEVYSSNYQTNKELADSADFLRECIKKS